MPSYSRTDEGLLLIAHRAVHMSPGSGSSSLGLVGVGGDIGEPLPFAIGGAPGLTVWPWIGVTRSKRPGRSVTPDAYFYE